MECHMQIQKTTVQKPTLFVYEGINTKGQKVTASISSESLPLAKAKLRKQGIRITAIKKQPAGFTSSFFNFSLGATKAINNNDVAIFLRQMATMINAKVPIIQSFDIVADLFDKASMRQLVKQIKTEVQAGSSFADALNSHPKYFDGLVCSLVASGEQSGTLDVMLERIAAHKEKQQRLKSKIKKELTYPIAVVVVAIAVMVILLVKVVPVFADLFESVNTPLPKFTMLIIGLSVWFKKVWWLLLGGCVLAVVLVKLLLNQNPKMHKLVDKWLLKMPVVGNIMHYAIVARFASTLATTYHAGVPLINALNYTAGATGNTVFNDATQQVKQQVEAGMQLHTAIKSTGVFPNLAVQLVGVGETSGKLDEMLDKVATYYEEKVDNALDGFTDLLEPVIMVGIGVFVGVLMVAMYLPIFQMGAVVG